MNTIISIDHAAPRNFPLGDDDLSFHPVRSAARKLLVVDDDPSIRPIIGAMIRKINPNSEIDWATSAEEALSCIQSGSLLSRRGKTYDLVLTDVYLGDGQTGIELAASCLKTRITPNLVLMTGLLSVKTNLPIITKPFRFESVKELLAPYLGITTPRPIYPDARTVPLLKSRDRSLEWFSLVASLSALVLCIHAFSTYQQQSVSRSTGISPRHSYQQQTISDSPRPNPRDSGLSEPSLVREFSNPKLQRAVQRLLKGGMTPLLKNPEYWKRMESESKASLEGLFHKGSSF